jgi:hypothetical protein
MRPQLTYPKKSHPAAPRDGDKLQARSRVRRLVWSGWLPRVTTLHCVHCGGPAAEYDHYLGYGTAHHTAVWPVCRPCHVRMGVDRGEYPGSPRGPASDACRICGEARPPYRRGRSNRCRNNVLRNGRERRA